MEVLVIGATGYIGSAVAAAFTRAGHEVAALSRRTGEDHGRWVVEGDLEDPASLVAAARGFDRVVHAGPPLGEGGGLVAGLLAAKAAERGVGVYIGEPGVRLPVVHVADLAALYLLVATHAAPGTVWHGMSETVRLDEVAAALGGGRAVSWPLAEARAELGGIADLFTLDQDISSDRTRNVLGWSPARPSLLAHLRDGG